MSTIYESINKVMDEMGAVGKDSTNKQQGFKYRGIDAVMNALHPAMTKHGIFVVPEVLEQTREERTTKSGGLLIYSICKCKYTFYAKDGTCISAVTIGEGMDSGDKATNKAMAIAFKYACFQVFCIPTEELKDPDADSPEPQPKSNSAHKEKEFQNQYYSTKTDEELANSIETHIESLSGLTKKPKTQVIAFLEASVGKDYKKYSRTQMLNGIEVLAQNINQRISKK